MKSSFSEIPIERKLYMLPKHNIIKEVVEPALTQAIRYDLMTAFFNSGSLKELAKGFSVFINNSSSKMRLIVSPHFSQNELEKFIRIGSDELYIKEWIAEKIDNLKTDEDLVANYTMDCLAYLIKQNRVEMRIGYMKGGGLFHPKIQLYEDAHGFKIAVHGSNNHTYSGFRRNYENVYVHRNWLNDEHLDTVVELECEFEDVWFGKNNLVKTYDLDESVKHEILKAYSGSKPTVDISEYINESDEVLLGSDTRNENLKTSETFKVPHHIDIDEGDFSHQGKAVRSWEESNRKGVLQMATGSGKTITSLVAAERLYKELGSLLIIIVVPYRPLLHQWEEVCQDFGLDVEILEGTRDKKFQTVEKTLRDLNFDIKKHVALITTNYMIKDDTFLSLIDKKAGKNVLLICDEVHNLGTESFLSKAPDNFIYRLGLSATPIRQYDEEGTNKLFDYFGGIVFEFSMKEAIGNCLVPYDYYVHGVPLSYSEIDEWIYLTDKINELSWAFKQTDKDFPTKLEYYLRERRKIIEKAENKITVFREVISKENLDQISHTLVYVSSKDSEQLKKVNQLLMEDFNLIIHQVTSKETNQGALAKEILDNFSNGDIKILTAMKVLDEGINLPQIKNAYIIASTTVEREWIQRRGRVLRKAKGKSKAVIHDFIILPPKEYLNNQTNSDLKKIVDGELKRVTEFAKLSLNASKKDGPLNKISNIINEYII